MHPISDFFSSLDAASYFLVNSGIIISITAAIFFAFGLMFGGLTWARYKRRWQRSASANEGLKADNAQLKRRLTEMATRTLSSMSSGSAKTQYVPVIVSPPVTANLVPAAPVSMPAFSSRSEAFTVWTETGWSPQPGATQVPEVRAPETSPQPKRNQRPSSAARSFSIWTEDIPVPQLNGHNIANDDGEVARLFKTELESGKVRHDRLLGIIFNEPPRRGDDLTKIRGINAMCRNSLQSQSIYTYKQIANWTSVQVGEFARRLSLDPSQVARWVDQASDLHVQKHGEPI